MYEFIDKNGKISANAAKVIVIDKNGLVKQIGTGGGGGGTSTRKNANNSTNNSINYCGVAAGTAVSESSPVWTITRLTIAPSGSVTTAIATLVAWTNRESVIYI